jgi:hypothetical protein
LKRTRERRVIAKASYRSTKYDKTVFLKRLAEVVEKIAG